MAVYSFSTATQKEDPKNKLYANWNTTTKSSTETAQNTGGFLGGLGYLSEKLAVGFMSSIEGIWDYSAGGLAKLFGADDWAEQQFANDWFGDWYSHPEEWYNPSDGWKTAGDVAGGIGTSLPALLAAAGAVGIAVGTGGAAAPLSAGILQAIGGGTAAITAGLGAAGNATKQAYRESGQLTGKEFAYGALSGVTEGALEGVTNALSLGTGQIIKGVASSFAKETVKTVARQGVVKSLAGAFLGEAFEEGMSEVLDPMWQRMTYNPNAKNATPQEIIYASFVGGMSGLVMGGTGTVYNTGNSFVKGNNLVGRGLDAEVMGLSSNLAAFETANKTGDETFQTIAEIYNSLAQSLEATGGKVTTVTQKKLLGDLHRANTVAVFKPMIAKSAANIVNNAEVIAERLNTYGYKTADGKPLTFTAEQIRAGVDMKSPSSFSTALKTNSILRELAIADTTGHLVMDTARFEQATLMGQRLASQVDLNRFVETATPSEINAVSQALGIENWAALDVNTFNQKIAAFVESGGVQQYADRRSTVQALQALSAETARPMPKMVNLRQDGSVRYSDGNTQIAISKNGDAYTVYDYASGHLSKNMTRSEVNKLLRDYNTQQSDILASARAQMEAESELRRQAEEIDTYARENISDYSKLSAPNQSMIRKVIREGRARGVADEDILSYAKISAHSGIDISFDKQATFIGRDEKGSEKYADGFYDPKTNRIVVNPDSKRTHERLLIHELDHAIRQYLGADGVRHATVFRQALEGVSPEVAQRIAQAYSGVDSSVSKLELAMDETNAYYAEEVLSNRNTLEKLIETEPTLKDKILSFFKGASEDYKSVPKLSKAARRYYKTYKKLFDEFAERNFQNNATEAQTARLSGEVSDARFSLQFADNIADNQRRFILSNNVSLSQDELELAIEQTARMVEFMRPYKDILPEDKVGKTLVKNGSYDVSVENTTICVRTLAYNAFVDMVSEKIGRPLTQMESFLVSQKLYDIAKEPQCLYCYVSLDRKAYNNMILRYIDQRDGAIEAYERAGRPEITRDSQLYKYFLAGRKDTKDAWNRYSGWMSAYQKGESLLTPADVATEAKRAALSHGTASQAWQIRDMLKYAQSASWAKKQTQYVAYYDDILRMNGKVVRDLNKHYGLRWYSFSDYSGAFIVENMQQITDASIRGLKGLAYTKDTDFVKIFASTGMNINISVYAKKVGDHYEIDPSMSANIDEAIALREKYPNVGIVVVATDTAGVEWALAQKWSDVVIPFHTVRTGAQVAEFYNWTVFNEEQNDTVADQNLWDSYVSSVAGDNASARKKVSKMVYPSEHQNNRETYLRLTEERGLKPRFSSFLDNPNYMKLVNETRQSEGETVALKPVFDVDAAEAAFQKFVDKGGYYEGWYNDGIDVEAEVEAVAQDVLAGKKANEVSYGRQDIDAEGIQRGRKSNREHGRRLALPLDEASGENYRNLVKEINDENTVREGQGALNSEELGRLEKVFGADIVADPEDRLLYERAVKLANGITAETIPDNTPITVKVVNPKFYTKEMLRTVAANENIGYKTKFFVERMRLSDTLEYRVEGLADTDAKIAYVKASSPKESHSIIYKSGYTEKLAEFSAGESSVSAISRHERLHLLLNDWLYEYSTSKTVLDAADDLRTFIEAEDGKYVKTFDKINYWYQKHRTVEYYRFTDYAQEVACDLYAGALKVADPAIQAEIDKLVGAIDDAIEGSNVDGVRYALPDSIGVYSDEERKSIEARKGNITARSYDDVLEFFKNSISDASNEGKTMFIGKISSKTADKIQRATGLSAFNKSIALNSHDLRHMIKEHGDAESEAMRNQEAISDANFEYVIETIADPDELDSEKDENSGVISLIFKKEISGKTTAITIFSEKRKTLTLKTAWIIKKEQHISQPTNAEALIRTPEARSSMDTVPTDSITDPAKKVNRKSENSSAKNIGASALDSDYMDAVNRGDMQTAQRMVDEAAKKAGYSTEHLYHGTSMFGFTNIDVSSASDDSISFFATNRQEVASGYMPWYEDDASDRYHDDVRRIGKPDKSRPRGLSRSYSAERILTEAQKVFPEYKDAIVATDDDVLANLKTYWLTETIEAAEKLREIELSIGSNKLRQQVMDMCDAVIATSKEDTLDAWKAVGNRYKEFDSIDIPYDATDMRPQIFHSRILGGLQQIGKLAKTTAIMIDGKLTNTSAIVDRYNDFLGGESIGMYDLYTKQGNQLVIQGRGSSWNQLPLGKFEVEYMEWLGDKASEELSGKSVTTRDVAAFAKAKGYRSVAFYDIYDNGVYGSAAGISDVYAFFYPNEDVKSADPVTYDDNGKVIPLSERFDSHKSDIRYALSETRGSIMTEVDPEYKPTIQDKVFSGWTAAQIAFTNAQAGIETVGRKYGVRNIESLVQSARSGRNQAEEMIAGNQYRIGADTKTYQGEGLEQIFRPIARQGEEVKGDFFDYLFNYHNMSRMTLEQRSMAEQQTRLDDIKTKVSALKKLNKRIEKLQEQIKALGRTKKDMETKRGLREELEKAKAEAKTLKKEATELEKAAKAFVPLENKPVLSTTNEHGIETVVTADQSKEIVKKYEKAYPEFKRVAEKVWAFLQNLNQYRVDTGLISQDTFDYLAKLYPHYVPTYRTGATKGIGAIEGKYNLKVKTTIKTAKGSTKNLLPPDVMIARQVMETVRAGRINQLANALYEGAEKSGDTTYIEVVSRKRVTDEEIAELDPTEIRPKNNEVVFFRKGERITMRVSKEIFAGFNAFNPEVEIHNPLVNGARAINNGFKRLVTSLNPAFLLRNTIRDVQDAGINTRYGKTFLKNYARASYEISHNGKLWQLYKAMGGFSSSVFDFEKGFAGMQNKWGLTKAEGNLLKRTLQGVENANAFVEQLPRLAEFISSIEAGNTAEQAILDSADVTTNFGRVGNITKTLNRTLIPFLNPSIQGCSKMIRNITSVRSAKEFASLALKAVLVGVAPMVLNMLMYEDDEDYKNLRDNDKENNFLFKVGDTFVKIPRGRVASVIGGLVNRGKATVEGENVDWADYVNNIMQQVTPVDSMSRTIFSPFSDVANNITWYGSAIEGRQFENTAPKDRYDENTSSIAIAIGQLINYSPKKIHYLLDQYSGVIGDFILPATTAKAEKDFLSGNFTLDPATSNKLSTEFYEMYDQAQYAKTAGDDTAAYQVRYLNKVKSAISDMYKQKSEIQNNPDLSNAEKLQQSRVVQLLINEAFKTALQDFELYTKAFEATAGIEDEDIRYAEATRLMYGAERALAEYNADVYAKCQSLNKAGIDYEMLYGYYFTVRGITSDKDADGNTISGSKRAKVVAAIKGMDISADQKLLLICASGYALQDNDLPRMTAANAKKRLLRYILKLKSATQTEKSELAEMCGFEVKNGRVVTKSLYSLG
jgi:hypothetical protein